MRSFRKRVTFTAVFLGTLLVTSVSVNDACAQNSKKVDQLNFQLPQDWPVEKRGGLITPIPTEEYVSMKFKEVEKEFEAIRDEFSQTFTGLEADVKTLEEDLSKQVEASQSRQASLSAGATGRVSEMEFLKNEIRRLDEKINDGMKETQGRLKQIDLQIDSIKENLKSIQTQIYKLDEKVDYWQENELRSY